MSNSLKGVLLASFAGWCWGSMAVCAQYLFPSLACKNKTKLS
ncbi:hypothetical protein [Turicimonas muris]|nr:hypothetical protein [Turicimonas muris]